MSRKKITEVFTPRNSEINQAMYVHRAELEKSLKKDLRKKINLLIFGQSGNGKSWLYKNVLASEEIPYVVANCANVQRNGSIAAEISTAILSGDHVFKTGYKEKKVAKVTAVVAEGGLEHEKQYEYSEEDPLLNAFHVFSKKFPANKRIIVLDNLECIFKIPALMEELANIIILLDDTRFAKYNTTFLIVGVPNGVLEYFSKTDHLESVSNRIREIEKVGSLKPGESEQIIQEGFRQLDIKVNTAADMKFVTTHIHNVTLGIAQKVHEYCEILAELIEEKKWVFSPNLVPLADILWLRGGLRKCYTVIEGNMNSRETTVARKNQVIFAIGKINRSTFDAAAIEKFIIQQFPSNVAVNMGIGKILSDLSKSASPLLVHNSRTNEYSVVDPQYLMCIRIMLYISQTTLKLEKRGFDV